MLHVLRHSGIRALTVVLALSGCVPDATRRERRDEAFLRIVAAEDARPAGGRDLEILLRGTEHDLAFIRHAAVRALGRLEDPSLLDAIVPSMVDPSPRVRRSAVNAMAQALHGSSEVEATARLLMDRVRAESDPTVLGTIARSLGRLRAGPALRREIRRTLVEMSRVGGFDARQEILRGVALGLASTIRDHPEDELSPVVVRRLDELTAYGRSSRNDPVPGKIRALALEALGMSGHLTVRRYTAALDDRALEPRAAAARHLDALSAGQQPELLRRTIGNRAMPAVLEGLLLAGERPRTSRTCRYLLAGAALPSDGTSDVPAPVAVVAIAALDQPCPDLELQRTLLVGHAALVSDDETPWQTAANALLALARIAPEEARDVLPVHASQPNPFVRAYAARAAGLVGDEDVLRTLSTDEDPNVRRAAVLALFDLRGHAVDELLLAQLDADDPWLILTVADLLEDTPAHGPAAARALEAFLRVSAAERETWRDARLGLLELLAAVGDPSLAPELEPFLRDYDEAVAHRVARLLTDWTSRAFRAEPRPLPSSRLPSAADLEAMEGSLIRLHMAAGGAIDIALDPYLAPTNSWRFFRLVREGYFDGLTFHRWVPNFVIQGGSPHANEYQGAPRHTRDEVGLASHWRGTVGISTRGRDTGDAQIFVNLLDNVRLDHDYTVVGTVVDGMDVVDATLEGSVIQRAEIVPRGTVAGMRTTGL
ncbi:MAG: peptidylprolyl isomerase [Longimicrobiales bacterium]|nr:peptidylprolyl isomerase [Longimicrobiales bacterium]